MIEKGRGKKGQGEEKIWKGEENVKGIWEVREEDRESIKLNGKGKLKVHLNEKKLREGKIKRKRKCAREKKMAKENVK